MKITATFEDGGEARLILAALVTDTQFLAKVAPKWNDRDGLFAAPDLNTLGKLCVKYFNRHHKAPGIADTETMFRKWAEKRKPEEAELVERLLATVSDEHEQRTEPPTTDFLLTLAEDHFRNAQLQRIADYAQQQGNNGKLSEAIAKVKEFDPIRLQGGSVSADAITPRAVRWLWPGWLARGELCILDALPAQGKSQLCIDLAARVSTGQPMPPTPTLGKKPTGKPAAVVIVSNEDSWATTILPRLMAADADRKLIFNPGGHDDRSITFPADIPLVEEVITTNKAKLLIIDTIMGAVGSKTDGNAEIDVRRFMRSLQEMVRRTGVAALLLRHFRKEGGPAIHRGLGSQAWAAFVRLQHVAGRPDPDGEQIVLAPSKNNLAALPKSLAYRIEPATVSVPSGKPGRMTTIDTSCIRWVGEVDVKADDVAGAQRQRGRPSRQEGVKDLITDLLNEAGGKMDADLLEKQVRNQLGISETTYKAARKELGLKSRREGFGGAGKWYVSLT